MSRLKPTKLDKYIDTLPEGYIEEIKESWRENADCHGCIYFIEEYNYCVSWGKIISDLCLVGVCKRRMNK